MSAYGGIDPADWSDPTAAQIALIQRLMQDIHNSMPVRIISCTNSGGVSPIGTVDVQPMIQLVSDQGIASPRGKLVSLPYLRVQGGANAVILDPVAGDIGLAVFAEKDISGMLHAKDMSPPGSARVFDMADGIYLFTIIGDAPTQFVQFGEEGITISSPTAVILKAPVVQIHAAKRWSWDVGGFGEQWEHTGGTAWTHTTWQAGATVTTVTESISPPDGTPSS